MTNRKRAKGRLGKLLCTAFLSAVIGLMSGVLPAYAVQDIDPDRADCTIRLDLKYKDASDTEQQMADGETIELYQVAEVEIRDGYRFKLTETFSKVADAENIPSMSGEELGDPALAEKLSNAADNIDAGQTVQSRNGSAAFGSLHPGLYLIRHIPETVQDVTFNPFLISIPDQDGKYEVSADPKLSFSFCLIDPPVIKKVLDANGNETRDTAGTFTFRMEPVESGAPMPDGIGIAKTLTLKGSTEAAGTGLYGTIYKDSAGTLSEFGEIQYGQEGSWHYRISEISASDGYSKDETVYTMTVTTKSNEHHKLEAEIVIRDQDGNITTENVFTFTNRLQGGGDNPPGGGGNPPGGGRRRRVTPPPTVPTTPGEVLGATRDVGRGVLGAVREPQVLGAVRTGDTNALIIWATILILAVSGFAGWISIYHRKKSTRLR